MAARTADVSGHRGRATARAAECAGVRAMATDVQSSSSHRSAFSWSRSRPPNTASSAVSCAESTSLHGNGFQRARACVCVCVHVCAARSANAPVEQRGGVIVARQHGIGGVGQRLQRLWHGAGQRGAVGCLEVRAIGAREGVYSNAHEVRHGGAQRCRGHAALRAGGLRRAGAALLHLHLCRHLLSASARAARWSGHDGARRAIRARARAPGTTARSARSRRSGYWALHPGCR